MAADSAVFLERWHEIVAKKDLTALRDVLAEDVSMGAPPYWDRLHGRELVAQLLGIVIHTIEDFTYHREWRDDGELALEFKGQVSGLDLQGVDLLTLDAQNRIVSLDVVIRPLNALTELKKRVGEKMTEYFAAQAASVEGGRES